MEPKRLWVVTECYPRPATPSHCIFAHRQLAGVVKAGWSVDVMIPNGWFPPIIASLARAWRDAANAHIPHGWSIDGVRVSDLSYQNRVPSRLSRPRDFPARLQGALSTLLREAGASRGRDVLLLEFALPFGDVVRRSARELGLPYVVHLRGDDVWAWPHQNEQKLRTFRETVTAADLVVGVSGALLDEARRLCDGALPDSAIVANGIDLDSFGPVRSSADRRELRSRLGIAPDDVVIISVGSAIVRKGWRELLDALGRLSRQADAPSVTLIAVLGGEAPQLDIAEEAARRAPSARVIVRQALSASELARYYRASDIFALASHWEGLANAVLEAMATGLPVVTTAVAGHPEIISDGVDGLLVPPRDAERLATALASLIESDSVRERLGSAARARACAIGDSKRAGARLASLLESVRREAGLPPDFAPTPYASLSVPMSTPNAAY